MVTTSIHHHHHHHHHNHQHRLQRKAEHWQSRKYYPQGTTSVQQLSRPGTPQYLRRLGEQELARGLPPRRDESPVAGDEENDEPKVYTYHRVGKDADGNDKIKITLADVTLDDDFIHPDIATRRLHRYFNPEDQSKGPGVEFTLRDQLKTRPLTKPKHHTNISRDICAERASDNRAQTLHEYFLSGDLPVNKSNSIVPVRDIKTAPAGAKRPLYSICDKTRGETRARALNAYGLSKPETQRPATGKPIEKVRPITPEREARSRRGIDQWIWKNGIWEQM